MAIRSAAAGRAQPARSRSAALWPSSGPAISAAPHAARYVSRARSRSNGSRARAAVNNSGGASLPKPDANATWARTRSTRARWCPSIGAASAVASTASAAANAPACTLAWAARSARSLRRDGSSVNSTERCRKAADAAMPPRAWARAAEPFELDRDLLARARCAVGAMPGPPIRIRVRIRRLGQREVDSMTVLGRRRVVGGRPDERVGELDATADPEQPGVHGWLGGEHAETEAVGSPMQQHEIALRLRGRDEHEQTGVARQVAKSLGEALLDLADDRPATGKPEAAGELGRVPRARELEQRQGVAVALHHDLLEHGLVERTVDVVEQQRASIGVGQSFEDQLRKLAQDVVAAARAGRTDDRDPLGEETTSHEAEDLSRRPIEPLGIVDDADQRLLLGDIGEQRQRRQPDQEAIGRRRPAPESEHRLEGGTLTNGEPLEVHRAVRCTADEVR